MCKCFGSKSKVDLHIFLSFTSETSLQINFSRQNLRVQNRCKMHYAICHFDVHFVLRNFWVLFVQRLMKEQITTYYSKGFWNTSEKSNNYFLN